MRRVYIITILFIISIKCFSQDQYFVMANQNYNYINPAFTGTSKNTKIHFAYSNMWPGYISSINTLNFNVDQHLGMVGGVGLIYSRELTNNDNYESNLISLNYSKQFFVSQSGVISIGASASLYQQKLYFNSGNYGSIVNPRTGMVNNTSFNNQITSSTTDFGGGITYYNTKFYIGYSLMRANEPTISVYGDSFTRHKKHSFQFGYRKEIKNDLSIIPIINSNLHKDYLIMSGILQINWKKLIFGVGLIDSDNLFALAGINLKNSRFLYSFGNTFHKLTNYNGNFHEISVQFNFNTSKTIKIRPFLLY